MPAPELQGLSDAAAQAAKAGDHASAKPLLTELAEKQEAALGPRHPALASTLNNLGVVCEALGQPDEAERHFRRACAIATAVLPPNHPFVATSRKNLEDLCRARGRPVDMPAPAPAADTTAPPADLPLRAEGAPDANRPGGAPAASAAGRWALRFLVGALVAAGVVAALVASGTFFRADRSIDRQPARATPASGAAAAPEPAPAAPPAAAPAPSSEPPPARPEPPAASTPATPAPAEPVETPARGRLVETEAPPASVATPAVVTAELCRDLSKGGAWRCTPPGSPVPPGPLYFYTRLKTPAATTVQHRWYRGDHLYLVVTLHVGANTASGWRTDSRITVPEGGATDWRVELRSRDGALLDEERFTAR